ncbi:hypothetical protein [Bifidobacterium saguinibicoloris]|uniref:hypothetical protein n=1 Tax=Bifidobacterium saguinibicoloris TaxID=2834433 RepID=UPI001F48E1CB|nr:hypothetical protein [Bifidobacterium saguinibicoloris]
MADAQREGRCAYSHDAAEQAALRRRARSGDFVRVYPGIPSLYAETAYWSGLKPPARTMHIARSLAQVHRTWVFGGLVAAVSYGFEHQWCLHDGSVTVATSDHGTHRPNSRHLKRVYVPKSSMVQVEHEKSGLLLLPRAMTLLDCAASYEFRFALPFFDSAFDKGITTEDVLDASGRMHTDQATTLRLLRHADANSENGGESLARGTMIEERFPTPRLQVPVRDPQSGAEYRADFVWTLADGTVVVGEYDGTRKYIDPDMTDNRGVQEMVARERRRDEALKRAGAREIVHFSYDDVIKRVPLTMKLLKAGIPRGNGP